ncbi:MAG: hypothetical protein F4Y04_05630 [Chloroflexi bacterium]|nr:hypothetical protein [Chloroflexota bacterium]
MRKLINRIFRFERTDGRCATNRHLHRWTLLRFPAGRRIAAGVRFKRRCESSRRPPAPSAHPQGCSCPFAAMPLTLERDAPSPRGMRRRWWPRGTEIACPDRHEAALGIDPSGVA